MGVPANASPGATTVHTATINDNDTPPTVQWTAASQAAAENVGTMTVTATLSAVSGLDVTVPFVLSGTASTPADYTSTASPLVIPAGLLTSDESLAVDDGGSRGSPDT